MEDLKSLLKKVLADNFMLYFKAHSYHWNVEGMFFPMMHDFFGKLYEELFDQVDVIAEHIRIMDEYAPRTLSEMMSHASITEDDAPVTEVKDMVNHLIDANNLMLVSLMRAYQVAEDTSELGVADYLQSRIDVHNKHAWMLKSILK